MATIKKRGRSYLFRVYAGYDINGRQIERTKTWVPPANWTEKRADKEARHQAELFEEQVRTGEIVNGKIKFSRFAELWFARYAEPSLRPRTIAGYKDLMRRIDPAIGHLLLERIRPTHLLDFYESLENMEPENAAYSCIVDFKAYLKKEKITKAALSTQAGISLTTISTVFQGKAISKSTAQKICAGLNQPIDLFFQPTDQKKNISPATVRHYHHLISDILGAAVKWQYIPYNPCSRISLSKASTPPISYLDDIQAKQLLVLLQKAPGMYRRAVTLLLLTGLRRGELLGLEWKDIHWKNKTLNVERTSQYLSGRGVFTDATKNKTSKRPISISDQAIALLQEQLLWQQRQRYKAGSNWISSDRIITSENGAAMRPDRLTHWFSRFIKGTDLPPIHLHSLRHTYATLCIANGIPITAVAAQLGHANVATTTTIYAHAIKSSQIAAAEKIGNLFVDIL